jgi:hypothetical protein
MIGSKFFRIFSLVPALLIAQGSAWGCTLDIATSTSDADFIATGMAHAHARGNYSDGINLFAFGGSAVTGGTPSYAVIRKFDFITATWNTVDSWLDTGATYNAVSAMTRDSEGYYWAHGYGRGGPAAYGSTNERWTTKRSCDTTGNTWPTTAEPNCASGAGAIIRYAYDPANNKDTWSESNQSITVTPDGAIYIAGDAVQKNGKNNTFHAIVRRCTASCTNPASWTTHILATGTSVTGAASVYYEPVSGKLYAGGYSNSNYSFLKKSSNGTTWTDAAVAPFRYKGVNGPNVFNMHGVRGFVKDAAGNLYAYGNSAGTDSKSRFIVWKATYDVGTNDYVFPANMATVPFEEYQYTSGQDTVVLSATADLEGNVFFTGAGGNASSTSTRYMLIRRLASGGASLDAGYFEIWNRAGATNQTASEGMGMTLDPLGNILVSGRSNDGGVQRFQTRKITCL